MTARGSRQADALSEFLTGRRVDYVVSSPYLRARQSIEPFAAAAGLTVNLDPRLSERTLFESPVDHWKDIVRDSFEDLDLHAPGGESAREVLKRAWPCLNELLDSGRRLPVVVTHGNLLSLVLSSLDRSFGYSGWEGLSNPDVFMLERMMDGCFVYERLWTP